MFKTDEISIIPNPSDGEFEVYIGLTDGQEAKIQLFNMVGTLVCKDNACIGQSKRIIIKNQPSGIYLLKIINTKGQIKTKIIIKE